MAITIEQVIEEIPDWHGRQVAFHPMAGGYSNANYQVKVDGQRFFVRIPGARMDLLGVDRENEYQNTMSAAEAGVGPKVVHYLQEHNVMVMEFIQGEAMSIPKLQAPGMPTRVAQSIKLLHAGPRFMSDFDIFWLMDYYLQVVADNNVRVPDGFMERLPIVSRIEEALRQRPMASAPCHNDLIAENVIDDGNLLRLVDFEYSGNNDPCFELGNAAQSLEYNKARTVELCTAYFGELRRSWFARVHLFALASHLAWTLWSAIQNKFSKVAYDFWDNAYYHWEPALKTLDSEAFSVWLEDAQRSD
jgi:thiamine kinase-like enzyme